MNNLVKRINALSEKQKLLAVFFFFALLIAVFYGNTLANGWTQDDHLGVAQNEYVKSLKYLPHAVTGRTWDPNLPLATVYYRPMQHVSYILSYQISSSPGFFHFANLVYFFGISAFLFLLVKELAGKILPAIVAAFIFLIHPINTEVVNSVAAIPELAMALFVLVALLFYVKARKRNAREPLGRHLLVAVAFFALALLSKEPAILLLPLLVFLDIFFFRVPYRVLVTKEALMRYMPFGLVALIYLTVRTIYLGGVAVSDSYFGPFTISERAHAAVTLFAQYLGKLIYPLPLLFMYTFEKVADFTSFEFFLSLAAVVVFFTAFAFFIKKRMVLHAFALAWFSVFIAIVVFLPDGLGESVFAERYMFLSAIGFAMFVGFLSERLWRFGYYPRVGIAGVLMVVGILSWAIVFQHNQVWANDQTLFEDILKKNPRADTMRFNYAVYLRNDRGDFDAARGHFEYIAENNPQWQSINMVYFHLGDYYRLYNDWEQAGIFYWQSLASSIAGRDWKGQFAAKRLSDYYQERGDYLAALPVLCQAVQLNPNPDLQREFNQLIDKVLGQYEGNQHILHAAITDDAIFRPGQENGIQYRERRCEGGICTIFISLNLDASETILPFLITAVDERGHAVEILNSYPSPDGTAAALEVDGAYKNSKLTFLFPTCSREYYSAVAE